MSYQKLTGEETRKMFMDAYRKSEGKRPAFTPVYGIWDQIDSAN